MRYGIDSSKEVHIKLRLENDLILELLGSAATISNGFLHLVGIVGLYNSVGWRAASRVGGLGTGNGYYFQKVAKRFPGKSYVGGDISGELIDIAKRENECPNVNFQHCDLFDVTDRYDFVVVRLILQHLSDVPTLIKKLTAITEKYGSVLVIDADDPVRLYWPDVPAFMKFLEYCAAYQKSLGLDRATAGRLPVMLEGHSGWKIERMQKILVALTIPGNLDLFRKTYSTFIELVESGSGMTYDFEFVKREWRDWCNLELAYTQADLNVVGLRRV